MEAYARDRPTEWFAEGRDPWRDLYTPAVISSIGSLVGINEHKDLDQLGVYLCLATSPYLMVMAGASDDAGIGFTRRQRVEWIDRNLIEPARVLIDSLDHAYRRYLLDWPAAESEWIDMPLPPPPSWNPSLKRKGKRVHLSGPSLRELGHLGTHRRILLSELNQLLEWAEGKKETVGRREPGTRKPRTKLRDELVYDLLLVYVTLFPNWRPTRASHDAPKEPERQSRIQSKFVEFVRKAAQPALGRYDNLDNQIQKAIERYRDEKTELWMRLHFFI
jgi:hypothetical protein